jgi:hypothetical protein
VNDFLNAGILCTFQFHHRQALTMSCSLKKERVIRNKNLLLKYKKVFTFELFCAQFRTDTLRKFQKVKLRQKLTQMLLSAISAFAKSLQPAQIVKYGRASISSAMCGSPMKVLQNNEICKLSTDFAQRCQLHTTPQLGITLMRVSEVSTRNLYFPPVRRCTRAVGRHGTGSTRAPNHLSLAIRL